LQSAVKTLWANGATNNFTISGTCGGTGNITVAPAATAATFEGVAGLSAVQTVTMSLTNCTPTSTAATSTSFFDSNFNPLGFNTAGGSYGVFLTAPTIPASVIVGGTATVGTETLYTDGTKTVGNGTQVLSYVAEADTANSAIMNLITRHSDASGVLTLTTQDRFRITATGALIPVSSDIQRANGSTLHLLLTYN
jgi:hypothetical protein